MLLAEFMGNALLINNPELGPSPVSVSAPAVNTNVETNAGAKCTAEFGAYLGGLQRLRGRLLIYKTVLKVIISEFRTSGVLVRVYWRGSTRALCSDAVDLDVHGAS